MPDGARPPLPDGPWLVVGLARSGLAAGELLSARGESVVGVDAGTPLVDASFPVHLGADGLALLDGVGAVVKSPGVPPRAAVVLAARERGIPVLGELELAWRLLGGVRFIAVTGTNGKTTVTEWIAHAHRLASAPVLTAGNVGTALSSLVGRVEPATTIVCECSSYQLFDTVAFRPDVGVLLDVGSDHLDWHGSVDAYRAAKLAGMFARQCTGDTAVVPAGVAVPGAGIRREWTVEPVGTVGLAGPHNHANAQAVAAACRVSGLREGAIGESLAMFDGVAHRQELVAVVASVRYINDSKATNVESLRTALDAMDAPVHLIAGGDDAKGEDFSVLTEIVATACATVHLIGDAAQRMQAQLGVGELDGELESAFAAAVEAAQRGDVILLSPGCASFDQFADFEARGRRFKELVEARRSSA